MSTLNCNARVSFTTLASLAHWWGAMAPPFQLTRSNLISYSLDVFVEQVLKHATPSCRSFATPEQAIEYLQSHGILDIRTGSKTTKRDIARALGSTAFSGASDIRLRSGIELNSVIDNPSIKTTVQEALDKIKQEETEE